MRGAADTSPGSAFGTVGVAAIVGGVAIGAVLATLVVGGPSPEPSVAPATGATSTRALRVAPPRPSKAVRAPVRLGAEATVRRFYRLLGQRRFAALYGLVGADFRNRAPLAEYAERRRGVQRVSVRRIAVQRLARDRAGADIDVLIVDGGATERCTGRLTLTRVRARWRIDPGTVACRT